MRTLTVVALAVGLAAPAQGQAAPPLQDTARLAELGRIWSYVQLFHPRVHGAESEWDDALLDAIPAVRSATSEEEYIAVLNEMLARTGDPAARVLPAAPLPRTLALPEPVRVEDGIAVASCVAIAGAMQAGADVDQFLSSLEPTSESAGAVVDCRDIDDDLRSPQAARENIAIATFVEAVAGSRAREPLARGGVARRLYNGFPTQGSGSPSYQAGVLISELTGLTPPRAASAFRSSGGRLAFLIDATTGQDAVTAMIALQSAGLAQIVAQGPTAAARVTETIGGFALRMSAGEYVYPDGAYGLHPDASASAEDDAAAFSTAVAFALGEPVARPSPPAPLALDGPPSPTPVSDETPTAEERLLALFRLWGVIEYFYPYKTIMDGSWDQTLEEFVPIFLEADSRALYETAVSRLAARMDDSHAAVLGLRATGTAAAPWAPPIYVRTIEGRFAVVGVKDASAAPGVAVGDEIVAIDGVPAEERADELMAVTAASTPQAMRLALDRQILTGPKTELELTLRGSDGQDRVEHVQRTAPFYEVMQPPPSGESAWSTLSGNVGYINLERLTPNDANRALDDLLETRALILDLRGYPQGTAWTIAPRLVTPQTEGAVAAMIQRPVVLGPPDPDAPTSLSFEQRLPRSTENRYDGDVFVLIDERTFSQGEHSGLFFEAAADVTFVGAPTNGTDGDITQISLPGGLMVRFTGQEIRHADGRQLQRVGLQPDVVAAPTLDGLRSGLDETLEAALALARR